MPSRFDAYRMKDGATPLSERFFNPVFRDIDLRIASIEELRIAWDEVVRTVTDLGLVRINEVLAPAFSEMQANMELADQQLALIESHRDAATRAVAGLELAIATYQGNAAAEIAAWKADLLAALVPWKVGVMADLATPLIEWYRRTARDLPWRRPGFGAWGTLVSEFMLQQTPVTRVIPHLEAWLARWPTPSARAPGRQ